MARKVKNERTGKTYDSIAGAERECGIYNITYNAQGKVDFVYERDGRGRKVYEKWSYVD